MITKKCKMDNKFIAEEDRISNLPRHLINHILDCLVINNAARTSVLSKTWRDIWETYPHLDLRIPFFAQLLKDKGTRDIRKEFSDAVCMILFAHTGPIMKFNLYMPPHLHESPLLHVWMKQVLGRAMRDLKLINEIGNPATDLSSHLFSCSELTELELSNCKLNPPPKFGGYHNLAVVYLERVILTGDMLFGTQIKKLSLLNCAGIQHLESQLRYHSQKLYKLDIHIREIWEKSISGPVFNPFSNRTKSINLYKLLDNMPNLADLNLNGTCLQFLDPGLTLHKRLITTMGYLKTLSFSIFDFNDMCKISNAFCLIRSSPNLLILNISLPTVKSGKPIELSTESYLESPDCTDIILDQLQTVEISNVSGSRDELLFIKILLAKSPSLRKVTLLHDIRINDPKKELMFAKELLQLPRKSTVQIFWSPMIKKV